MLLASFFSPLLWNSLQQQHTGNAGQSLRQRTAPGV